MYLALDLLYRCTSQLHIHYVVFPTGVIVAVLQGLLSFYLFFLMLWYGLLRHQVVSFPYSFLLTSILYCILLRNCHLITELMVRMEDDVVLAYLKITLFRNTIISTELAFQTVSNFSKPRFQDMRMEILLVLQSYVMLQPTWTALR